MTTTLCQTDQALLAEFGSTIPEFIKAVKTERRQTDCIDQAIKLILGHPDVDIFEAFDIVHGLMTLNRRDR